MLQQLLGVEAVWCDTRSEDSSQQFVLWVGAVLDYRPQIESALQGRRFAFSLLAHSDQNSPMLDFLASSSVLQVGRCGWAGVLNTWEWVGLPRLSSLHPRPCCRSACSRCTVVWVCSGAWVLWIRVGEVGSRPVYSAG